MFLTPSSFSPKDYALAQKKLKVHKNNIGFVSSNYWDICGASSFGLRTFWINDQPRRQSRR